MEHLLRLIQENKIVGFYPPIGYDTTMLSKPLADAGYNVTVVSDILPISNISNVAHINTSKYKSISNKNDEILIVEDLKDLIDLLLIVSQWMKSRSKTSKLVINSSISLFPDAPYYIVPNSSSIQIRYIKDYSPNSLLYKFANLIYKVHNSSMQGDFLVLIPEFYRTELENMLLNMDFNFINNKRNIVIWEYENLPEIQEKTDFSCIFDIMMEEKTVNTLTGGIRKEIGYGPQVHANIRANYSTASQVIVYRTISQETFLSLPELPKGAAGTAGTTPLHHLMIDLYERKLNPFEILLPWVSKDEMDWVYSLFLDYGILDISLSLTAKAKILRKLPFGLRPALLCIESNSSILPALIDNYMFSPFLFSNLNENVIDDRPNEDNLQESQTNAQELQEISKIEENNGEEEYNIRDRYEENKPVGVADYSIDWDLHVKRYYNRFRGESDVETFLNMYNDSLNKPLTHTLHEWCRDNAISYEYMNNVYSSIELVNKFLNSSSNINSIDTIIPKLYSDRQLLLDTSREIFTQYIAKDGKPYSIDSMSINLIEEKRPSQIISIISSTIGEFNSVSFSYIPLNMPS